jgi:hypothetical protein
LILWCQVWLQSFNYWWWSVLLIHWCRCMKYTKRLWSKNSGHLWQVSSPNTGIIPHHKSTCPCLVFEHFLPSLYVFVYVNEKFLIYRKFRICNKIIDSDVQEEAGWLQKWWLIPWGVIFHLLPLASKLKQ